MVIAVPQSVELRWATPDLLKSIEDAGRTCYKSHDKITPDSADRFCTNIIKHGHESVLEHGCISFKVVTDRAIAQELTRHRLMSTSAESTRYVAYRQNIGIVLPLGLTAEEEKDFLQDMQKSETVYKKWLASHKTDVARDTLPLCLAQELVLTMNVRQLRHIIRLRSSMKAHPKVRIIAKFFADILAELSDGVLTRDLPNVQQQVNQLV